MDLGVHPLHIIFVAGHGWHSNASTNGASVSVLYSKNSLDNDGIHVLYPRYGCVLRVSLLLMH